MPQIEVIRPLKLQPTGGQELIASNRGSNTVFYGPTSLVSATNKTGSLLPGEALFILYGFFVWVVNEPTPTGVLQQPAIMDLRERITAVVQGQPTHLFPEPSLYPNPSLFPH